MKFFHLSDLHLGKHLHNYNLCKDQQHILKEVIQYAGELHPDAILIAGDIYDKSVPSAEAVSLFDEFLTELSQLTPEIPLMIISGNHDSGERLDYAREILHRNSIYIAGKVPTNQEEHLQKVMLQDEHGVVNFYLLPFVRPTYVRSLLEMEEETYTQAVAGLLNREGIDYNQRNVLISHQFYTGQGQTPQTCDSELIHVGGLDNVDILAVKEFDYVALGHIHGRQQVGMEHIQYCGTLLKYSVSEANHKKVLTMVTLNGKGKAPVIQQLPLHPLHDVEKKEGLLEDILREGKGETTSNYVSVTLKDEGELYKPREQLLEVYPLLLELTVDNTRTRKSLRDTSEQIEIKSPLEMYEDFYQEVHGRELSQEGEEVLRVVLEEVDR